jgi:hypothetical protein
MKQDLGIGSVLSEKLEPGNMLDMGNVLQYLETQGYSSGTVDIHKTSGVGTRMLLTADKAISRLKLIDERIS